jgi:hypothetical protein
MMAFSMSVPPGGNLGQTRQVAGLLPWTGVVDLPAELQAQHEGGRDVG